MRVVYVTKITDKKLKIAFSFIRNKGLLYAPTAEVANENRVESAPDPGIDTSVNLKIFDYAITEEENNKDEHNCEAVDFAIPEEQNDGDEIYIG